jgi:ATP synthase protein I
MAKPHDHRDKAPSDFETRLEGLEAQRSKKATYETGKSLNEGYRLVASLISGVLVGLGLGWLIDRFAHTSPWGLIGGLLVGVGVSLFNVVQASARMSKQALKDHPAPAVPFDDKDDD